MNVSCSVNRYFYLLPLPLLASCTDNQEHTASLPEFTVSVGYPLLGEAQHYREWIGEVTSMQKASILPQISGYITERRFKNGQMVKEGDILYQIDPQLYQQALKQAQQGVAQKQAALDKAKQNLDYYAALIGKEAISRQSYTDAQQAVKESQAALEAARAAAQQAQINLGYCTLRSPIAGVVGFAQSYAGAYVSPNGSALVEVTRLDPIRINFAITEQEWLSQGGAKGALSPGKEVDLLLADGASYPQKASIEGVDNKVNTATGSLMLDAHVSNPQGLLRPGMFAKVRALTELQKDVLWVPQSAIARLQGMSFVLAYPEGGKVSMIPVELGMSEGERVVIVGKGITASTRIITNGTQQGMMAAAGRCTLHIAGATNKK